MYSAKKAKLCVTFYFKVFFFQSWRDVSARVRGSRQFNPLLSPRTARGVAEIGNGEISRFHKCFSGCIYQGKGEVNVVGETEELEDFEVFNIRNTVNIIAYSVMSTGAEIWNILYESLITDFFVVRDWIIALLESRLIFMIFSGNHSQQCCTSHCWAPVKKVWYDNM